MQNAVNQPGGFGGNKNIGGGGEIKDIEHFLFGVLGMADLLVGPEGLGNNALFNFGEKTLDGRNVVPGFSPPYSVTIIQFIEFFFRNSPV